MRKQYEAGKHVVPRRREPISQTLEQFPRCMKLRALDGDPDCRPNMNDIVGYGIPAIETGKRRCDHPELRR